MREAGRPGKAVLVREEPGRAPRAFPGLHSVPQGGKDVTGFPYVHFLDPGLYHLW